MVAMVAMANALREVRMSESFYYRYEAKGIQGWILATDKPASSRCTLTSGQPLRRATGPIG